VDVGEKTVGMKELDFEDFLLYAKEMALSGYQMLGRKTCARGSYSWTLVGPGYVKHIPDLFEMIRFNNRERSEYWVKSVDDWKRVTAKEAIRPWLS
jgi:hypothetical protein